MPRPYPCFCRAPRHPGGELAGVPRHAPGAAGVREDDPHQRRGPAGLPAPAAVPVLRHRPAAVHPDGAGHPVRRPQVPGERAGAQVRRAHRRPPQPVLRPHGAAARARPGARRRLPRPLGAVGPAHRRGGPRGRRSRRDRPPLRRPAAQLPPDGRRVRRRGLQQRARRRPERGPSAAAGGAPDAGSQVGDGSLFGSRPVGEPGEQEAPEAAEPGDEESSSGRGATQCAVPADDAGRRGVWAGAVGPPGTS